jgi:hypothetical protein
MTTGVSAVGCRPLLGGAALAEAGCARQARGSSEIPHHRHKAQEELIAPRGSRNSDGHGESEAPREGTPPHKARPPARTTPNMNLIRMVVVSITTSYAGRLPPCKFFHRGPRPPNARHHPPPQVFI